jgi:hypothetical protein
MRPGRERPGVRRLGAGSPRRRAGASMRPGRERPGVRVNDYVHRRLECASMRPERERPGVLPPVQALLSTLEIAPPASCLADRSQVRRGFGHWTGSRLQTTKRNQHGLPSRALPAISSAPQPSLRCGSLSPNPSDDHGAPLDRRECLAYRQAARPPVSHHATRLRNVEIFANRNALRAPQTSNAERREYRP